jgi:4-hydroxybenzoate polyprenyltransferase
VPDAASVFPIPRRLRVHLELARIPNLPTIWSNCVAAWVLVHGDVLNLWALVHMTAVMTLVYVGGMYLNDACDAGFDAVHHSSRPIPSGRIGRTIVFGVAFSLLAAGLMLAFAESLKSFAMVVILTALVIAYDVHHRRMPLSPLLISACRAMIYLTIWIASAASLKFGLIVWAIALAAYVTGLSYVAKVEETNVLRRYSPAFLLLAPAIVFSFQGFAAERAFFTPFFVLAIYVAWVAVCLLTLFWPGRKSLGPAVSRMLAGICLVDLLAVSQVHTSTIYVWQTIVIFLFALSLWLQRSWAAT